MCETSQTVPDKWEFFLLHPEAKLPTYATDGSAAADIYAIYDSVLKPMSTHVITTGLATKIPNGHYVRIAGRSGLAAKHGIQVFGGVIDPDYYSEIKIILHNTSTEQYSICQGQRIAQAICEKYSHPEIIQGTTPAPPPMPQYYQHPPPPTTSSKLPPSHLSLIPQYPNIITTTTTPDLQKDTPASKEVQATEKED